MAKLLFRDGRLDKVNCTAGWGESHGYQGLPKGSVRTGYQGNQQQDDGEALTNSGTTVEERPFRAALILPNCPP